MENKEELTRKALEFRSKMLALDAKWEGNVPGDELEAALRDSQVEQLAAALASAYFASENAELE